jgi:cytochrome c peroxidase
MEIFKTIKQVIDFYNEPDKVISNSINRDSLLAKPFGLNQAEKNDLEAFLLSLTDEKFNDTIQELGIYE